jgi:peptidylprolyl isomerase/FKBP-type peptidyl-prolyl cis-trans isomerase FklB
MRRLLVAFAVVASLAACGPRGGDPAAAKAAAEWMAENAKQEGVVVRPSGLQYKVLRSGPASGVHPRAQDEVRVHYEGTLVDGKVFDSSYRDGAPVVFTLGNLIPGWVEGIGLMRPGDEWLLYVPPELGYGDEDKGEIPPNSVLVFRVELFGVLQHSAAPGLG